MSTHNTEKESWLFILELETGLIDGWYRKESNQFAIEDVKAVWDDRRPQYTHMVCSRDGEQEIVPDNRCLHKAETTRDIFSGSSLDELDRMANLFLLCEETFRNFAIEKRGVLPAKDSMLMIALSARLQRERLGLEDVALSQRQKMDLSVDNLHDWAMTERALKYRQTQH